MPDTYIRTDAGMRETGIRGGRRKGQTALKTFFEANPSEELTVDDAAIKAQLTHKTAQTYLANLTGEGILERVSVYRLKRAE
jgi:Fic family protein